MEIITKDETCPICGSEMIDYDIIEGGEGLVKRTRCPECGETIS